MKFKITESSLSRIWEHNVEHDCGAISAFRKYYKRKENRERSREMSALLVSKGYSVTKLKGKYPEEGGSHDEEHDNFEQSFWVVDSEDTGNLEKDLLEFGRGYEQDSVLFCPVGAIDNKAKAYLNVLKDLEWASAGDKSHFDTAKLGHESPIYTSYINGRPFLFESIINEIDKPQGMAVTLYHKYLKEAKKRIGE